MAGATIRRARPDEAAALTALALRSKAHWPYSEDLMAVFRRTILVTPGRIAAAVALVHETAGVVDGFGLLRLAGDEAELDDLWVDPPAIGGGVGRRLLDAFAAEARRGGAARILLNADPYAEGFYRRLGAERIGDHPVAEIPGRILPRMALRL